LPALNGNEHLVDTQYTTFVLRFVLSKQGQIVHGELIDVASSQMQRFKNWNELIQALGEWLRASPRQHE
jgi:hypothetical protein